MSISRRTFLIGAAGGALVLGGAAERATTWERQHTIEDWASRIARSPSARDLGLEYLTRVPEEHSASLLQSMVGLVSPFAILGGPARRAAGFYEQHQRDFEQGNLLRMGGWLLSRTELRLCALAMLEHQKGTRMQGVFAPMTLRGETYEWTAPHAAITVRPDAAAVEFQLKSGAPTQQHVIVRLGGTVVDELDVAGLAWRRIRYVMRHIDLPVITLDLETSPVWKPAFDYRTLGVAIQRIDGFV